MVNARPLAHAPDNGCRTRSRTSTCLEIDDICDSRKFVSKPRVSGVGADPPIYEVGVCLL
jgi:hypothetical protein